MDATVTAAVVGGAVAFVTSLVTVRYQAGQDRDSDRNRLDLDFEFAERRKVREAISKHHGRVLDAADQWNARMRNLYDHESRDWLLVDGNYVAEGNTYFRSTVCRFLTLVGRVRLFERDALFIDERYARTTDAYFVNYMRALRFFITDTRVTRGVEPDEFRARDHFFADQLREIGDAVLEDGDVMPPERLLGLVTQEPIRSVCAFFDGLRRDEPDRVRWDRLVAHHLIVMAFVNSFGYPVQKRGEYDFVAEQIVHDEVRRHVGELLSNQHLIGDLEAAKLQVALG